MRRTIIAVTAAAALLLTSIGIAKADGATVIRVECGEGCFAQLVVTPSGRVNVNGQERTPTGVQPAQPVRIEGGHQVTNPNGYHIHLHQ